MASRRRLQDPSTSNQTAGTPAPPPLHESCAIGVCCSATVLCQNPNQCCSNFQFCGVTQDYCGEGCLSGPCLNSTTISPVPAPAPEGSQSAGPNSGSTVKDSSSSSANEAHLHGGAIAGIIIGAVVFLLLVGCLAWWWLRWRSKKRQPSAAGWKPVSKASLSESRTPTGGTSRPYSLQEIKKSCDDFSAANKLGHGGFGTVYRGVGPAGELWAIKRSKRSTQRDREAFETEVRLIRRMNHRNLVALEGWCAEAGEQILVYELVANGDLACYLRESTRTGSEAPSKAPLTFEQRLRMAVGAARGLNYLHDSTKECIVHRDVKASNILIDENFEAKVADFGLSRLLPAESEASHYTTALSGTHGYIDPEYLRTHKVTQKIDVYSFGVVLLELITGRRPIIPKTTSPIDNVDDETLEYVTLAEWAVPWIQNGSELLVVDPELGTNYDVKAMRDFCHIAAACVERASHHRPTMAHVRLRLEAIHTRAFSQSMTWGTSTKWDMAKSGSLLRSVNSYGHITDEQDPNESQCQIPIDIAGPR